LVINGEERYMTNILMLLMFVLTANGSSVQDYIARPGDSISVTVWEQNALSGIVLVDSNGNISLPMPIGSFPVVGLASKQISDTIIDRIKEYIVNPTVFVYIIPAEGFIIHVTGEVQRPGFVKVPAGTTIQEAIGMMNDFTTLADKRNILLIRKKNESDISVEAETMEQVLNFELFIDKTDRSANPYLKPGDVIIVPRLPKEERIKYINVIGAVIKPGTFETDEPLPLVDVISKVGGLSDIAIPEQISILSKSADGTYKWKEVKFTSFLIGKDPNANPIVERGDTVFIPREPKDKKPFLVNVIGQVARPGSYPVTDESRLIDAIYTAGGFVDEAAIERVTIIRGGSKKEEQVNIKQYLISSDEEYNPLLDKGDTIFVPITEGSKRIPSVHSVFFPTMRVSIIGEVTKPDTYQVSANVSVLDVLKLTGGHTSQADLERVTIIHETAKSNKQQQSVNLKKVLTKGEFGLLPKLEDGDTVFVPRKPDGTIWGTIVKTASGISTVAIAYLIITGKRAY
jgi:protein involved in polysaccharide export with SLBB domain